MQYNIKTINKNTTPCLSQQLINYEILLPNLPANKNLTKQIISYKQNIKQYLDNKTNQLKTQKKQTYFQKHIVTNNTKTINTIKQNNYILTKSIVIKIIMAIFFPTLITLLISHCLSIHFINYLQNSHKCFTALPTI